MRKRISFTLITLIMVFLSLGTASPQDKQESDNKDFGLTIGLTEYQIKEKVLNNVRHSGTFISGGLFYERSKETSKQRFELYSVPSKVGSRYDPDKASTIVDTYIKYRYARKVKDISQDLSLFLGGITGLDSRIAYYANWDESHFYWLTSYDLGFDGILTYQKSGKSSLWLEINAPLVSLVSRPPERFLSKEINPDFWWIIGKLHEDPGFTSIHKHFALSMDLGYTFQYSSKFKQSIFWRFCFIKNSMEHSKDISILTHTLGITFLF